MKIAVTAASGQLGGAIVRALAASHGPRSTVALARTPAKAEGLGVEVRPGDYGKPDELLASLSGVDALLLVSGMAAPDERIRLHRNVIDAARSAGVQKLVYTSIQGLEEGTGFSPIVRSNRQTEADVRASGLEWAIGRNGIYIEPDVEYIARYEALGEVANCAGEHPCGYTTRDELGHAYGQMLTEPEHVGQTYDLHGEPLTQAQLTAHLNDTFGLELEYRAVSFEEYLADRTAELGPFLGGIIAGIYEGIAKGAFDGTSHYERAAGRPHRSWDDYFGALREAR